MAGIQFFGIENVIKAYCNKKTPSFAIWSGKQLLFKYDGYENGEDYQQPSIEEGEQLLAGYLSAMYQDSTATYTLKTYDDLGEGKIKPSSEYDTSFNFKISLPDYDSRTMGMVRTNPMFAELQKINARLESLEHGEPEEDAETLEQAVIGLIQEPDRLQRIVEPIRQLVEMGKSLFDKQNTHTMQQASIGNVRKPTVSEEDKVIRLGNAIDILEKHDNQLVEHLERLAALANANPKKFKNIISMIGLL